jgi:hypothetical protein
MEAEQRRAAKEQMMALMQTGHRWQEAAAQAGLQVSRSTAYRLLRQVRSRGKAAARGWKTRAPCQAANRRAGLAGNLLPHVARHSKPCSANSFPGTIRHSDQSWLFEPGPCNPRPGKPHPRGGEKNAIRPCSVNPSGKRVQGDCSWLRQPRRLVCSPLWKPPCLRVLPVAMRAWRIFQRGLVTC